MIGCAVALVLLLDASASIRAPEWALQVEATAGALVAPSTTRLIDPAAPLAVTAIAFAETPTPMVGWTLVADAAGAAAFAQRLAEAPRPPGTMTATGAAMEAALDALDAAPCRAEAEVIDLATDGESNIGPSPQAARDRAIARGAKINAIGVGRPAADWLREHAATPSGFVIQAEGWEEFAQGMRRKLALEVASADR